MASKPHRDFPTGEGTEQTGRYGATLTLPGFDADQPDGGNRISGPGTTMLVFDPATMRETLLFWHRRASVLRTAHRLAAGSHGRLNIMLGGLVAILAAIVGATVLAQMAVTMSTTLLLLVGCLSLLAAGLTATQNVLGHGARQQAHARAAHDFDRLQIDVQELLSAPVTEYLNLPFHDLAKKFARTEGDAPLLSKRFTTGADAILHRNPGIYD